MGQKSATMEVLFGDEQPRPTSRWPERALRWMANRWWQNVLFLWGCVFIVGIIGFWMYHGTCGESYSVWGLLYLASQLLTLNWTYPTEPLNGCLYVGGILAPFMVLFTAAKAVARIFEEPLRLFILHARYEDHVVICGLGRKGWLFAEEFSHKGDRVIVIEKDEANENLKECDNHLIMVLRGEAQDPAMLEKACVAKAKRLICVCGEDGTNVEIAVRARELVKNRQGKALRCMVHVFSPTLCRLLQAKIIEIGKTESFWVDFFNIFENGAGFLLEQIDPLTQKSAEIVTVPRLLIVGFGWLGQSLVVQAARKWWITRGPSKEKLPITIIDREAKSLVEHLKSTYTEIGQLCNVEFQEMEFESARFEKADFLMDSGKRGSVSATYICIDNQPLALACALTLQRKIQDRSIPIVVRLDFDSGFATLLEGPDTKEKEAVFEGVYSFGLFNRTCNSEQLKLLTAERIAMAIHDRYVASQRLEDASLEEKPYLVPWEKLPWVIKESNRRQAADIGRKLKVIGCGTRPRIDHYVDLFEFSPEEVEKMAELEHERWCAEKESLGWEYAPVRNDAEMKHDCLLPWDKLDEKTKEIDREAVRNLPRLLAMVNLDIYRLR